MMHSFYLHLRIRKGKRLKIEGGLPNAAKFILLSFVATCDKNTYNNMEVMTMHKQNKKRDKVNFPSLVGEVEVLKKRMNGKVKWMIR